MTSVSLCLPAWLTTPPEKEGEESTGFGSEFPLASE